ncbi:uncharacterized protein RAG0_15608 [Rhynchosporium agropyri]|uniref:Uncharacterized protein n=2 Tax=Rhynchosporium TaxID=38037 RepID=A0A1E1LLT2_9HELO|nr:uncharacterized protein RAG0_15608 [Rhynchosporium agropyri]CZT12966.1 uncharacterized protein RCO7_15213 [Rhynchosporium commune]
MFNLARSSISPCKCDPAMRPSPKAPRSQRREDMIARLQTSLGFGSGSSSRRCSDVCSQP